MTFAATAARALALAVAALVLTSAGARAATVTEFFDGITEFSSPAGIAAGPDGAMWFTEPDADQIGRITTAGAVTEFDAGIALGSAPLGIALGPDGNMWFTEYDAGQIGRITPAGVVTEFSAGISVGASPRSIVAGPDGNLWYTDTNGRTIGRITTGGAVTEVDVDSGIGGGPDTIAVGPDANLWFTEYANGIGRVTTAATPVFTRFAGSFGSRGIAKGPDATLWTTEGFGAIRHITAGDPAAVIGTFALAPEISAGGIAAGPDGNMWFADGGFDSIGRVTASGQVAIVSGGVSVDSDPRDIALGPDGNLWFTEPQFDQIGRVTPTIAAPTAATGDASAITTTTANLTGTVAVDSVFSAVRFEYGTTNAYGTQTPLRLVDPPDPLAIGEALTNLRPATTYHFRLIASNGAGSAQSADRTFTTAGAPTIAVPACANGRDDDRDGFTDARDPGCHADGNPRVATTFRPQSASESPVNDPVLVCSSGGLALRSAELVGARKRVRVRGNAERAAGQRVGIYVSGHRVASAVVRADGSFQVTFAARGNPLLVRYQARIGDRRSKSVAVQRRLAGVRLSVGAGKVVLSGRTSGRRPRSVELLGRAGGCGALGRLATARVRANGTFRLSAAAFTDVDIASYRVRIAAAGAAGRREASPPRALELR